MVDKPRRDGVARTLSWRAPPSPLGTRPSPETSTEGSRLRGTPSCVEKVSSEDSIAAASSLIRWGGSATVLGGLSTTFVFGLLPPHSSPNAGDSIYCAL